MTFRQGSIRYWRRKKPLEGRTKAVSGYCLTDHFHRSGLERKVCDELRLRKLAHDIKDYRCEVAFDLELQGVKLGRYYADFVVENNNGTKEVIEAKGIAFPLFKQKWKILLAMFKDDPNYTFRIVTA